ncbi:Zn-finger containing protein [Clostridium sp. DL-VIII]|uniref:Zn-finger containing protein n=1 Tax=Clostridium sp. DL-VIII TaxID=641107 RepID=UPI00023B06C0|nr:Zn-finger containing protein [Clostridium sp. DL-VIII]EHJ02090.1 Zn-finger containing protein [Clostridium sp. DL-VIII]
MEWFKRMMYGRYGGDQLSRALLGLSFVLLILTNFLPRNLSILVVIAYIPTVICIFRIFSKNIYKRQQENYKYIIRKNKVLDWFKHRSNKLRDMRTHKYFVCKNCKQKLRVPRGQGKISITCPKCKNSFKAKS